MRHRVALFLCACGIATNIQAAQELRIVPQSGATFAPAQRFDIRVEGDALQGPPRGYSISINGRDRTQEIFAGQPFETFAPPAAGTDASPLPGLNGGITRRNWTFDKAGTYEITATLVQADGSTLTARSVIEVPAMPAIRHRAKNIILFVGDGMGQAQRTAARIASKGIEGGKARGLLEMDQMEMYGVSMTSSLDALVTDSSPGASAWATGNKSLNNWHGVFPDNNNAVTATATELNANRDLAASFLDNPRVENLAEFLQRTRRMSTGVVTTVAVTDSTPGSFSSHSIRYAQNDIAEQMLSAGHSVILGGGARYFLPPGDPLLRNIQSGRTDTRNLVDDFRRAGYAFASNAAELQAAATHDKVVGLFHGVEFASRYDRMRAMDGNASGKEAVGQFPDQPTLEAMTEAALKVLGRNRNGFFLMVEGGSVDREYHRMDPSRGIYEVIELDKAIGAARAWAARRGNEDTLIIVTADHETAGLALTGVNENGVKSNRAFPNYEDRNLDGFPDSLQPELAITFDFPSAYNPTAETRYRDMPRNLKDLNPSTTIPRPEGEGAGHSAVDVPIGASGPGASLFSGTMDNTEIFFRMLRAIQKR